MLTVLFGLLKFYLLIEFQNFQSINILVNPGSKLIRKKIKILINRKFTFLCFLSNKDQNWKNFSSTGIEIKQGKSNYI